MALVLTTKDQQLIDKFFKSKKTSISLYNGKLTIVYDGFSILTEDFPKFMEQNVYNQISAIYKQAASQFKNIAFGIQLDKATGQIQATLAAREEGSLIPLDNGDLVYDAKSFFTQQVLNSIVKVLSSLSPEAHKLDYTGDQSITAIANLQLGNLQDIKAIKIGDNAPTPINIGMLISDDTLIQIEDGLINKIDSIVGNNAFLFNHDTFVFSNSKVHIDFIMSQEYSKFNAGEIPSVTIQSFNEFPADLSLIDAGIPEDISEETQQVVDTSADELQSMIHSYTPEGQAEYQHKKNLKPNTRSLTPWELSHTSSYLSVSKSLYDKLIEKESAQPFIIYGINLNMFKPANMSAADKDFYPIEYNMHSVFKPIIAGDIASYTDKTNNNSAEIPLQDISLNVALQLSENALVGSGPNSKMHITDISMDLGTYSSAEGLKTPDSVAEEIADAVNKAENLGASRTLQKQVTPSSTEGA